MDESGAQGRSKSGLETYSRVTSKESGFQNDCCEQSKTRPGGKQTCSESALCVGDISHSKGNYVRGGQSRGIGQGGGGGTGEGKKRPLATLHEQRDLLELIERIVKNNKVVE